MATRTPRGWNPKMGNFMPAAGKTFADHMADKFVATSGMLAQKLQNTPVGPALQKFADDTDYKFGEDILHASPTKGLTQIDPRPSAAADQGGFGLTPGQKTVFGYRNPEKMFPEDPAQMRSVVNNIQEKVRETKRGSSGESGSMYIGRMPRTGIMEHEDLGSWAMSSKPIRVSKEIDISGTSDEVTDRLYPSIHGGKTPDDYWKRISEEAAKNRPKYDPADSVV